MTDERPISSDDEEHLVNIILDSIREAEKSLEEEGPLGPEAFLALARADLAAEKLNARLLWLRAEQAAIVAGLELRRNILGRNFASG